MDTHRAPSVLTSEVYNEAEIVFNMLESKEKLISFLDCMTLLRGMGMNPTQEDMDYLRNRMADPILRLEQWRREEELRREKERRREELREKKRGSLGRSSAKKSRKSIVERALEAAVAEGQQPQQPVKIVPVEEIKNIDWNIFISCAEEIYRDAASEQKEVYEALKVVFKDAPGEVTLDDLVHIVTTNGESVLTPLEVKQMRSLLPQECTLAELAARFQGTYMPPTQQELDKALHDEMEKRRQEAAAAKEAEKDILEFP